MGKRLDLDWCLVITWDDGQYELCCKECGASLLLLNRLPEPRNEMILLCIRCLENY